MKKKLRRVAGVGASIAAMAITVMSNVPAQAALNVRPVSPQPEPQNLFSGYSAVAKGKHKELTIAQASWVVPKVSCSLFGGFPRAAVWVGLWGSTYSMSKNIAWLPQIGTDSSCNRNIYGQPFPGTYYFPVWEMASQISGQGNIPQGISSMTINPGDQMAGAVEYEGADKNGVQHFQLSLNDVTVNAQSPGSDEITIDTATTEPVKRLSTIIKQGGAVVEGEPATKHFSNGLAEFDTPVTFTNVQVYSSFTGVSAPASVRHIEWIYEGNKGHPLAVNSSLSGNMFTSLGSYTVTWKSKT